MVEKDQCQTGGRQRQAGGEGQLGTSVDTVASGSSSAVSRTWPAQECSPWRGGLVEHAHEVLPRLIPIQHSRTLFQNQRPNRSLNEQGIVCGGALRECHIAEELVETVRNPGPLGVR